MATLLTQTSKTSVHHSHVGSNINGVSVSSKLNGHQSTNESSWQWKMENVNHRVEAFLACAGISTFFLAFAISDLQSHVANKGKDWDNTVLFWIFCISQSLAVGSGLFSTLCFSFIAFKLKRKQATDHWDRMKNGSFEVSSYELYKDASWSPWFFKGCCDKKEDYGTLEVVIWQSGIHLLSMFVFYIIAVIFYITDRLDNQIILLITMISCISIPLYMAMHILLKKRIYRVN
mmetsp:Transcript_66088/g.59345  ORF Transcript_66088/g.59345 Transcript_66088/m.59345 type:complete len:232 (+) Transcript_66088:28-723(+)